MAEKTQIPAGPWTVETLGDELYKKLGVEHGILDPALVGPGYRPALDLTEPYNAQEAAKAKKPAPKDPPAAQS